MVDREARDRLANLAERLLQKSVSMEDIEGQYISLPLSRDAAERAILGFLQLRGRAMMSSEGCDEWGICPDSCEKCVKRISKKQRKIAAARRSLARAVRFLGTDQEYEWNGIGLTWWMVPIVTVVFLVGSIICIALGASLAEVLQQRGVNLNDGKIMFCIAFPFAILFLLFCEKLSPKNRKLDRRYWPFANREKCEAAGPNTA